MTEETKVDPNKGVTIPGETDEGSLSPRDQQEIAVKDKARSFGWKPRKEWEGDPGDWVSAREFIARQSFFDKIRSQSTEIRNLRDDIKMMSQHFSQMKDVEYKRALSELKSDRKEAIASGDSAKAESVSDQIVEIEKARAEVAKTPQTASGYGTQEFNDFKARNPWYNTDSDLTKRANVLGVGFANMNPQATPDQVLAYVEDEIKKSRTSKVVAPASPDTSGVKGGGGRGKNKLSEGDLTPMQIKIMNTLVQRGVRTKEQYLADLTKAEGVVNASSLDK